MFEIKTKETIVPCRWNKSGWKYLENQPYANNFFLNPNRENYTGFREQNIKVDSPVLKTKSFDESKSNDKQLVNK